MHGLQHRPQAPRKTHTASSRQHVRLVQASPPLAVISVPVPRPPTKPCFSVSTILLRSGENPTCRATGKHHVGPRRLAPGMVTLPEITAPVATAGRNAAQNSRADANADGAGQHRGRGARSCWGTTVPVTTVAVAAALTAATASADEAFLASFELPVEDAECAAEVPLATATAAGAAPLSRSPAAAAAAAVVADVLGMALGSAESSASSACADIEELQAMQRRYAAKLEVLSQLAAPIDAEATLALSSSRATTFALVPAEPGGGKQPAVVQQQ